MADRCSAWAAFDAQIEAVLAKEGRDFAMGVPKPTKASTTQTLPPWKARKNRSGGEQRSSLDDSRSDRSSDKASTSGGSGSAASPPSDGSRRYPASSRRGSRSLYFGNYDESITPEIALGVLKEARGFGINAIRSEDIAPLVVPQLNFHNCLNVLLHPELEHHDYIAQKVCDYVGRSMLELLLSEQSFSKLLHVSKKLMINLVSIVSKICTSSKDADLVVRFLTEWAQVESACDLLKECKQWAWAGADDVTPLRESLEDNEFHKEWQISNVKSLLTDNLPVRYVHGMYFDWCVRLDHGSEGKLRIVYESATETSPSAELCLMRFPAAMFAWQVIYKGTNVFHERPVFICFPQNVSLHWSTTLPVSAAELQEDDEITIICQMVENPLVSLILYHFSSDLVTTVKNEDILNRLPHIEFRCVSSYMLFKQHLESTG